jgi:hypothetical protein
MLAESISSSMGRQGVVHVLKHSLRVSFVAQACRDDMRAWFFFTCVLYLQVRLEGGGGSAAWRANSENLTVAVVAVATATGAAAGVRRGAQHQGAEEEMKTNHREKRKGGQKSK